MNLNTTILSITKNWLLNLIEFNIENEEGFLNELLNTILHQDLQSINTVLVKNNLNYTITQDNLKDLFGFYLDEYRQNKELFTNQYPTLFKNQLFLDELEFVEDLQQAIINVETKDLKQMFQEIDNSEDNFELNEAEIATAIENVENRALKEEFKEIDEKSEVKYLYTILKYAAILIIGIIPFYFIKFNNSTTGLIVDNNIDKDTINSSNQTIVNYIQLANQTINNQSVLKSKSEIIQEEIAGYGHIKITVIDIEVKNIEKLIYELNDLKLTIPTADNNSLNFIQLKTDSLFKLTNTYVYSIDNQILLNLNSTLSQQKIVFYKINQQKINIIKIGKEYFEVKKANTTQKLQKCNNPDWIEAVEDLNP